MRGVLGQALLASLLSLAAEVVLTGVFAVLFPYDAVFALVGAGLLGTGLGAAWAARRPVSLGWAWLLLGAGLGLAYAAVLLVHNLAWTGVFGAVALVPFVPAGVLGARLFSDGRSRVSWVYAAEMAGVAAGGWAGVLLLDAVGGLRALLLLALAASGAGILTLAGWRRALAGAELAALGLAWVLGPGFPPLALERGASPDKTLLHVLRTPGHPILGNWWNAFGLTTLVGSPAGQPRLLFLDAGAGSYLLPRRRVVGLPTVAVVPYSIWHPRTVLDIGAGAGADAVAAVASGARRVVAVDINPALPRVMRGQAAFSGGVYLGHRIRLVVADGRRYVERTSGRYQAVVLDLVYSQAAQAGTYALAEGYAFTVQAFRAYLRHLAANGVLVVVSHQAVEGSRALFTALEAAHTLWHMPYREALRHVLLVFTPTADPQARPTLLVLQRWPFTVGELMTRVLPALSDAGLSPLYIPYVFPGTLAGLAAPGASLRTFLEGAPYNYGPTTDNQPFFFQFTPGLPSPLWAWLALSAVAWGVALLVLRKRGEARGSPGVAAALVLTGAAFAAVEVVTVSSASLVAGYPTLAFAAVLMGLGVGAGLAGGRLRPGNASAARASAWAAVAVGLTVLGYPALADAAVRWPGPASFLAFLMSLPLVPVGLVLGRVFPSLLAALPPEDAGRGYALSALGSMSAAVLTEAVALTWGFAAAGWSAAVAYGLSAWLARRAASG